MSCLPPGAPVEKYEPHVANRLIQRSSHQSTARALKNTKANCLEQLVFVVFNVCTFWSNSEQDKERKNEREKGRTIERAREGKREREKEGRREKEREVEEEK